MRSLYKRPNRPVENWRRVRWDLTAKKWKMVLVDGSCVCSNSLGWLLKNMKPGDKLYPGANYEERQKQFTEDS